MTQITPIHPIHKPKQQTKILFATDYAGLHSGYGRLARHIMNALHQDPRFAVAQLAWFHRLENQYEFPWPVYTTLKDHRACCRRGTEVMEIYRERQVTYASQSGQQIKALPADAFCGQGHTIPQDRFGATSINWVTQMFKPDVVVGIGDQWMMAPLIQAADREAFQLVTYTAVDGEPMPRQTFHADLGEHLNWQQIYHTTDVPVAFCDWAKDTINAMMGDVAVTEVIPHPVQREVYKPLSAEERLELRTQNPWGFVRMDQHSPATDLAGRRLVLYVGRNIKRKEIPFLFESVQYAREQRPEEDIALVLHTPWEDHGWNMDELVRQYDAASWTYQNPNMRVSAGVTDTMLNDLYNIADAHLHVSSAEGWDLPCLESLAAGVPTLQTAFSAPMDWGQDLLELVPPAAIRRQIITNLGRAVPDYKAVGKRLLQVLASYDITQVEQSMQRHTQTAAFDLKKVQQQWIDLFAGLEIDRKGRYAPKEQTASSHPETAQQDGMLVL